MCLYDTGLSWESQHRKHNSREIKLILSIQDCYDLEQARVRKVVNYSSAAWSC